MGVGYIDRHFKLDGGGAMLLRRLFILILFAAVLLAAPAFASISATAQWNVRTDGAATNGGFFDAGVTSPGTDYSLPATPQISFTDMVIQTTTTTFVSALNPATTASPGNGIYISGGTGTCTVGWYEILSQSGGTYTMDRAMGTATSTCTGYLGGGVAAISTAISAVSSGNTINIKSGTYTLTTVQAISTTILTLQGYGSAYGDGGTKPLITTSTNSTILVNLTGSGAVTFNNLAFTNTAGTSDYAFESSTGSPKLYLIGCYLSGFTAGIYDSDITTIAVIDSEITASTSEAIDSNNNTTYLIVVGSYFYANNQDIVTATSASSYTLLKGNIFAGATSTTSDVEVGSFYANIAGNTFFGAASTTALTISGVSAIACVQNNIFYGNNKAISETTSQSAMALACEATNAYGDNANANTNWAVGPTDISLSGNPFVASGSQNFALNGTAGAGAAVRAVGTPLGFGSNGTVYTANYLDVGAAQHQGATGGAAANSSWVK